MSDYFLEDEEYDDSSMLIGDDNVDDDEAEGEDDIGEAVKEEDDDTKTTKKKYREAYKDSWTEEEIYLSQAYDSIMKAAKLKSGGLEDIISTVIKCNPKNTSAATVNSLVKEALHRQGHGRIVNTVYTPDTFIRNDDIEEDLLEDESSEFNANYAKEARERIADFVEYLASRDLSQDSTISRRRKLRQLPAFIIFLFSIGEYDLIINCPTMPEEYAKQITNALEIIMKEKYSIVEELARRYEEEGRDQVAKRVRDLGLTWFEKEPNEIRTTRAYEDLDLTPEDVQIYREYRSKFTNASKAITQDLISDLIEVVIDPEAMVYERLKDKTRADAISDVKDVFKKWNEDVSGDSQLATQVIWGDFSNDN